MKIHLLSDTHNHHDDIYHGLKPGMPGGDMVIHSGDATNRGRPEEIIRFLDWYAKQEYKHKILVPGNHDFGFEEQEALFRDECEKRGIILLINQATEIEGIKIWGSPWTPRFFDWAFNADRGHVIRQHWELIPDDTEILITHGPPAKILDFVPGSRGGHVGCTDLFNRIVKLEKLKLHVFGHIHYSRGTNTFKDILFMNASSTDDRHNLQMGVPWKLVRSDGKYELEA